MAVNSMDYSAYEKDSLKKIIIFKAHDSRDKMVLNMNKYNPIVKC